MTEKVLPFSSMPVNPWSLEPATSSYSLDTPSASAAFVMQPWY